MILRPPPQDKPVKNGQARAGLAKAGINQPKLDWPAACDSRSSGRHPDSGGA